MSAPARSQSHFGALIALAVVAVLTAAGFVAVLTARYSSGEGYPIYSTLRSDPLGARALYEALDRLPMIETSRNYQRLDKLKGHERETLLMLNVDAGQFNSPKGIDGEAMQSWVLGGGRLIITLSPTSDGGKFDRMIRQAEEELEEEDSEKRAKKKIEEQNKAKPGIPKNEPNKPGPKAEADPETKTPAPKNDPKAKLKAARNRLGIRVKHESSLAEVLKIAAKPAETYYVKADGGSILSTQPALPVTPADMPRWFSNSYFDDNPQQDFSDEWRHALASRERHKIKTEKEGKVDSPTEVTAEKAKAEPAAKLHEPSPWRVLASKGNRAMIVERNLGTGTVVVCSDSYFLSNEALWKEPKPQFLSWLIGDATSVIFDETHLGALIGEQAGIMTLARRYGMHGLFIAGLVLFGLFIWRSATTLVPRDEAADLGLWRADAVAGRSTSSGLEGLLRRGVKPRDLLQHCFEAWSSTRTTSDSVPKERRANAASILAEVLPEKGKHSTPAPEIYRRLRDALHKR
jgi:hypothetical protein